MIAVNVFSAKSIFCDEMPRNQIQDVLAQMSLGRYGSHIDRGLWVWLQLDRTNEFPFMGGVPTAIDSARCVARRFGLFGPSSEMFGGVASLQSRFHPRGKSRN